MREKNKLEEMSTRQEIDVISLQETHLGEDQWFILDERTAKQKRRHTAQCNADLRRSSEYRNNIPRYDVRQAKETSPRVSICIVDRETEGEIIQNHSSEKPQSEITNMEQQDLEPN